ncbi:MAG TPA: hypothetical protein VKA54_18145 [Gemmatimonadaceae bacterium]|nr:hypothetical protein [Gemmatimonadaceae bacterium]
MIELALLATLLVTFPATDAMSATPHLPLTPAADSTLVCVASRPTASPLDTVEVRAFADSVAPARRYRWTTTGGEIVAGDSAARWTLERAGLGVYTATAELEGAVPAVRCSVRIVVVPPRGHMGGTLRARAYLAPDQREEPGYAVYSYLLFGAPPDSASSGRYRLAIAEFVRLSQDIDAFHAAQRRDRGTFNMSYMPVARAVREPHPDSVLKYYDYATAQVLLRRLPGTTAAGPYLVSVPGTPLSRLDALPSQSIVQDLSTVPGTVVAPWVRHFLNLATQERFGAGGSMKGFVLSLRTGIGVAALGLSDVTGSLVKWKETWGKLVTVQP